MTTRAISAAAIGPDVGRVAGLIGDPVRSRVLFTLLDGRERSASELALGAGASPQAASAHLHKLVDGGLLTVRSAGRQRLFRLASAEVASAIETLASIAPPAPIVSLSQHTRMERLRAARTCYDHLAGRLGVGVTESLLAGEMLAYRNDAMVVTPRGEGWFRDFGVDLDALRSSRRGLTRVCLDWTERRHHVAGGLGAALLARLLEREWVARNPGDRALRITPAGRVNFERRFGIAASL